MKQPIVFSPKYDMTLMGMEKLHPFDSAKYGKVFKALVEAGFLNGKDHFVPHEAPQLVLEAVHAPAYLKRLEDSKNVAQVAEIMALQYVPNGILQNRLLRPMRFAVTGTIMAFQLAMKHQWAINLAGGYHHAKAAFGSGFCYYADINIAAHAFWAIYPNKRILVVDLDAHQGNGFAHTFGDDPRVAILDVYNGDIYPNDTLAKKHVKHDFPVHSGIQTQAYLDLLNRILPQVLDREKPDLVVYNAGSDIYEKDPLGQMKVSAEGVMERDRVVFAECRKRNLPVAMLLSGGYVKESAALIARSILQLRELGLLSPNQPDVSNPV